MTVLLSEHVRKVKRRGAHNRTVAAAAPRLPLSWYDAGQ